MVKGLVSIGIVVFLAFGLIGCQEAQKAVSGRYVGEKGWSGQPISLPTSLRSYFEFRGDGTVDYSYPTSTAPAAKWELSRGKWIIKGTQIEITLGSSYGLLRGEVREDTIVFDDGSVYRKQ